MKRLALLLAGCAAEPPPPWFGPARVEWPPPPEAPCPLRREGAVPLGGLPVLAVELPFGPVAVASDRWVAEVDGAPVGGPIPGLARDAVADGATVYVASSAGLLVIDVRAGALRVVATPAPARAVDAAGGRVAVVTEGGELYELVGDALVPRPSDGMPDDVVLGPGGGWVIDRVTDLVDPWGAPLGPAPDPASDRRDRVDEGVAARLGLGSQVVAVETVGGVPFVALGGPGGGVARVGGPVVPVPGDVVDLAATDVGLVIATRAGFRTFDVATGALGPETPLGGGLTAVAWRDGQVWASDERLGLVPTAAVPTTWVSPADVVAWSGAVWLASGAQGRLDGYDGVSWRAIALPGPAARMSGDPTAARLRVLDGALWAPLPSHGVAVLRSEADLRWVPLWPGAFDVARFGDDVAVAAGTSGVVLLDPDTLAVRGRCDLPGETVLLATEGEDLWAFTIGSAHRWTR
jgi:hypothetical protein